MFISNKDQCYFKLKANETSKDSIMVHYPGCISVNKKNTYMEEKFVKVQVQKGKSSAQNIIDFKYIKDLDLLIVIYKDSKSYIRYIHLDNQEKIIEHTLGSAASFSHVLANYGSIDVNAEGVI